MKRQLEAVSGLIKEIMIVGQDYDKIPGTQKPTLLKPGAERLLMAFGLAAIEAERQVVDLGNGHREYIIKTRIVTKSTGLFLGEASGSCSTMESKYRYRYSRRKCPDCNAEAISISKFGDGGYYCNKKAGGCGANFDINDPSITTQVLGRVDNEDIADVYNTVLKMGQKRSIVAAVLLTCGVSALFTQDLEEMAGRGIKVNPDTGEVITEEGTGAHGTTGGTKAPPAGLSDKEALVCAGCNSDITTGQDAFSRSKFGKPLCPDCQKKAPPKSASTAAPAAPAEPSQAKPSPSAPKAPTAQKTSPTENPRGKVNSAIYAQCCIKGIPEADRELRHALYNGYLLAAFNQKGAINSIHDLTDGQADKLLNAIKAGELDGAINMMLKKAEEATEAAPIAEPAAYPDTAEPEDKDPFGD